MEENEKREALKSALLKTDTLIDGFLGILQESESPAKPSERDFSSAVEKILPQPYDRRKYMSLDRLSQQVKDCTLCQLCKTRTQSVFGEGCSHNPMVMVVGEGPGETEDKTGRPFVGKAGLYLDQWLASISLSRDSNTYIANIVKCRPPLNRDPEEKEKIACMPYLVQQIALIKPRAILCLGKPASTSMTGMANATMASLRGRITFFDNNIPMICTYHPAAILRDPSHKRDVWEDLQKLANFLNLPIHRKQK